MHALELSDYKAPRASRVDQQGGDEELVCHPFDWIGVRARALRDRAQLIAVDKYGQTKVAVDGDDQESATAADANSGALAEPHVDLHAIFRRLKHCWVTTTVDGVTTKEWRAPDWSAKEWVEPGKKVVMLGGRNKSQPRERTKARAIAVKVKGANSDPSASKFARREGPDCPMLI